MIHSSFLQYMWVMPSSSARCAQLPRAADKVPFYAALKKFRDYLNGVIPDINESEMVFSEPKVKSCYEAEPKSDICSDLTDISNAVIKSEDGSGVTVAVACKKKRGRPKKVKIEGEEPVVKPVSRKLMTQQQNNNNCDFPKKKRGRPKKVKAEDADMNTVHDNGTTSSNVSKCYSNSSPIQSPNNFYQMVSPPNSASNLYAPQAPQFCQSPRPPYSQSPRPRSQPFTHSDLSSEISAAISSEQLGSPASPSLGPPDFEPPTSMAEDGECRLSSPAPSTPSEQQPHYPYAPHHPYAMETPPEHYSSPRQPQDIASKSLSGLESLVDQIPSIAEGEPPLSDNSDQYGPGQFGNYNVPSRSSPAPYNYAAPGSGYPLYPTPTWSSPYEPVPLTYPQIPYAQSYASSLHVPGPNYPYYTYPQTAPTHPPGYPPYLGGF